MINFEKFELDNGLKVIVHQDKSTPIVAFNLLYDVGARDEDPTRTGFAHLFEHLMFGGSVNISNYEDLSDFFLFDSKHSGSGIKFDWSLLNNITSKKEFFLSGGLNLDNLKNAMNNVNTLYFDISSGVEKSTGVKDTSKIADIMKIANG